MKHVHKLMCSSIFLPYNELQIYAVVITPVICNSLSGYLVLHPQVQNANHSARADTRHATPWLLAWVVLRFDAADIE
jgi:hypothetical protein